MKDLLKKYPVVILSLFAAALAVYFGFFHYSIEQMKLLFVQYTWYFIMAASILFLQKILEMLPPLPVLKEQTKKHVPAMLLAVALTASMSLSCKPEFRILSDETNLASVSLSMFEEGTCKNITRSVRYYHGFRDIITCEVDHRPALYPFLVSILHTVTGYRAENSFIVNAVSGCLTLFLMYLLVCCRFGRFWGIASMLLLSAYPLFLLCTMSGGFESVNLMLAMLGAFLFSRFLLKPDAEHLELVLLLMPLLSQTRYESAATVFCVLVLVPFILPKQEYSRFSWRIIVYPALFLPIAWQRAASSGTIAFQVQDSSTAFSLFYFKQNIVHAFEFFLGYNREYGMVPVLFFLMAAGFFTLIYSSVKNRNQIKKNSLCTASFIFLFYLIHSAVRFSFYWGNLKLWDVSRLGLIYLPLMVYFAICFLFELNKTIKHTRTWVICISLALIIASWPVAGQNMSARNIEQFRGRQTVSKYLNKCFPEKDDYILISSHCNFYIPLNYSTMCFSAFRDNINYIEDNLKHRKWQYLVFVQWMSISTNTPEKNSEIPKEMDLMPVYEFQVTKDSYIRISVYYPPWHPKKQKKLHD